MSKKLFIYRITARGLFSELNILLLAKFYAMKYGYDFKIELGKRDGLKGDLYFSEGIDRYFDLRHIEQFQNLEHYSEIKISEGFGASQSDPYRRNFQEVRMVRPSFDQCRGVAMMMPFNRECQELMNRKMNELGLTKNQYYFFHIRRGDKLICEAKLIKIDHFFEQIKFDLDSKKKIDVFIGTDDYKVILEAKEYLKKNNLSDNINLVYLIKPTKQGHNTRFMNDRQIKYSYNEVMDFLTEIEISRHSIKTYCTYSSNVGRFMKLLHDDPKMVYSMDTPQWFSG